MDGVEALMRLRADPVTSVLRVVALTAFAMNEDRQRLLGHGFDGYLEKPIDVHEFPGQIATFLSSPTGGLCVTTNPAILVVDDSAREPTAAGSCARAAWLRRNDSDVRT